MVESVVPSLMMGLEGSEDKRQKSLEGLSVILSVRPSALGAIVPRLTQEPLTKARVEALADLMQQSGGAADAHVPRVLPMLFAEASRVPADEIAQACQQGVSPRRFGDRCAKNDVTGSHPWTAMAFF